MVEHAQRHLKARRPSLSLPLVSQTQQEQHKSLKKTKSWADTAGADANNTSDGMKSRSVENVAQENAYLHTVTSPRIAQGIDSNVIHTYVPLPTVLYKNN